MLTAAFPVPAVWIDCWQFRKKNWQEAKKSRPDPFFGRELGSSPLGLTLTLIYGRGAALRARLPSPQESESQIINRNGAMDVNVLLATAGQLRQLLSSGAVTSRQLVTAYLSQIRQHDDYLRAVISTAPVHILLRRAGELDLERKSGRVRSPMHGIPILVKDNIATSPATGLDTTAGSLALVDSRPRENAPIIDRVRSSLFLSESVLRRDRVG